MDGAASGKHFKNNLKLVLCAIGIVLVVAILIAMRPIQSSKNAISRPAPAAARAHNAANLSTLAQAAPINQAASAAAATGVSIAAAKLQAVQPGSTPLQPAGREQANTKPLADNPPVLSGDEPVLPINPIPCDSNMLANFGCRTCDASPIDGNNFVCPRCPTGGAEIMCAYP